MNRLFVTLLTLIIPSLFITAGVLNIPLSVEELQPMIETAIERLPARAGDRFQQVESMKKELAVAKEPSVKLALIRDIISEYRTLSLDSMVSECRRGLAIADSCASPSTRQWIVLKRAAVYPRLGVVAEALSDVGAEIDSGLFPENRGAAFAALARIHFNALVLYGDAVDGSRHLAEGRRYLDSLKTCHYSLSPINTLISGMAFDLDGAKASAEAAYTEVIRSRSSGSEEIAQAAMLLARLLSESGRRDKAFYYLSLGAFYDLNSANLQGLCLSRLGFMALDMGKTDLGRRYLAHAFTNSSRTGDVIQASLFSRRYPSAINDLSTETHDRETRYIIVLAGLLLALCGLALSLWQIWKGLRSERQRTTSLVRACDEREEAIGCFLEMAAGEQEITEDFHKVARRKIAAGQIEDLKSLLRSQPAEASLQSRFAAFDRGFACVCPGFVDKVNDLLLPDRHIVTPSSSELTPELRVLAFARLGIDDARTVSRFLGLSQNTVYTYRNKLRSRAVSRDTFDAEVVAIGRS